MVIIFPKEIIIIVVHTVCTSNKQISFQTLRKCPTEIIYISTSSTVNNTALNPMNPLK